MLKSSKPPVGAIAFGKSGVGCTVAQNEGDRVVLQTPSGLKRVPIAAITRWKMPTQKLKPGDRVRYIGKRFAVQYGGVPMIFRCWHHDGLGNAALPDGNITTWLYAEELERWEDGDL
ncbi:hypothetical protein [Pseudanabaena sp. PCC 6802]|uniref:hypothetical protein n=1 Tax=Pseudanabaena sp. PCC 6802 TaxID=118173 RepID=UPI000347C155|nr:hypothetical protein [Pseudanabaena sp. PCC 6802]